LETAVQFRVKGTLPVVHPAISISPSVDDPAATRALLRLESQMRAPAWWTSLSLIGLAVACGDQPTEMASGPEVGPTPGAVSLAVASSDDGLAIVTDQDDYAPGDTVWFAGAGWSAGDTLDIELVDDPLTHPPHTWWVPVEGNGTFRDSTYVVDAGDVGVTFTLTAVSRATGRSLTVRFTDGNLQQIGLSPTIRTVAAGGAASYTANVRMEGDTGACAVTLSVISPRRRRGGFGQRPESHHGEGTSASPGR
jgi:hypothetical protein